MSNDTLSSAWRPSFLDRALRPFTDVHAGEGLKASLLSLNVFLLLTAYYVLKPVREALILGQGSAEEKSYLSAVQVILLAFVVPLYGRMVARLPRRRLINAVNAFFAGCLVLFYVLSQFDVPLAVVYFLWIGIFNVMIIAQFWAFANDVYNSDQGQRLFPIIGFGASLGAVLGAVVAEWLIAPIGVYELMLVGAFILMVQVQITNYVDRRERAGAPVGPADAAPSDEPPPAVPDAANSDRPAGSFSLVFRSRYLLLLACMVVTLNWVNSTGEYVLGRVVSDAAQEAVAAGEAGGLSEEEYIGEFYSSFYAIVNIAGLLIQMFLVSRIVKYLGVPIAILFLPCIALSGYGILALYPILTAVRWAKTAENSADYSLQTTAYNMLFLPCTREQKYAAKQAIDSFFVRSGDVLSASLVFVGTTYLALGVSGFAAFNIVLVLVWLTLAVIIGRQYRRFVTAGESPT